MQKRVTYDNLRQKFTAIAPFKQSMNVTAQLRLHNGIYPKRHVSANEYLGMP